MSEVQKTPSAQSSEMIQQFVQFVMMQAQNILFVLGKIPTPDGGAMPPNLQAAKMLIDQLDMIKVKTSGNLSPQESRILDEALSNVQIAFAEASGGTPASMMPTRNADFDVDDVEAAFKQAGMEAPEDELEEFPEEPPVLPSKPEEPKRPVKAPQPTQENAPVEPEEHKKKFFKSYG